MPRTQSNAFIPSVPVPPAAASRAALQPKVAAQPFAQRRPAGSSIQRMEDDYRPPPLPTLWDWVQGPLRRAEYQRKYPTQVATVTDIAAPVAQYPVMTPGTVPQHGVLVKAPTPQKGTLSKVLTPLERAQNRSQKSQTQPQPQQLKKKKKYTPLTTGLPDIGGYLNTLPTPGHPSFHDIVIFSLNNNPGFNQIHVHRNSMGVVLQISKKNTTTQGNGPAVPLMSALGQAAIARAANY